MEIVLFLGRRYFFPMKIILKWMLIIAASLVSVICIVCFAGLLWIKSNNALQWVQSRINTEISGKIIIDSHRLSLLKPALDLYGVVLQDSQGHALAGIPHLSVGLDWRAVWQRELKLDHILVQEPWLDLVVDEKNGSNLETALMPPVHEKKTEAPTENVALPFNIVLASIQLTGGRFTYITSDQSMRLEASGLTLLGNGNFKKQAGRLELAIDSLRFHNAEIHPQPSRILLKAELDGDELRVPTFKVTSNRTSLSLTGSVDDLYGTAVFDSVLSLDSQLEDMKNIFSLNGEYSGPVNANLTVKGPAANPDVKLVMSADNGLIDGQPMDKGKLAIDLKDRLAKIETAAFRLGEGSVVLAGTISLRHAFPEGFLTPPEDINAIDYDLALQHDIPNLSQWLKPFIALTGASSGRMSLTGKGVMPSDISARLRLEGNGRKLLAPGMDRSIDADVNLSAQMDDGMISISRLSAVSEGVELSGDGHFQVDDEAIAAQFSLQAKELSRVMAVAGIPSVNGACTAELTVGGSLAQPQFALDLASKNLKTETYSLGD